jgi:DNA-binding transcriptional ArsR family regulator
MARLAAERSRSGRVPPRHAAPVFSALGDDTRLRIVARLCSSGPLSIARLTEGAQVTRQAVTKHLHILAAAGLLRSSRDGREQVWEMQPKRLIEARQYLDLISDQWDEVIERLRELVEKET